ncbi:hypothetical protein EGI26_21065 [Lacihabitans sp. CCS-44]|uniref:metallophosphoesterase family protein n=1 Tax=Lacihabitans sp. CCS-44 TaxID=2487331 RepID=UPI0020CB9BFF|nr:metallophosphoesterase [Lacihabitans sp. CCS-44]MCP9757662.1 hypothetical protein [Lacihabitans sp. CCS-44]
MKSIKLLAVLFLLSSRFLEAQMPFNYGSGGWKYYINNASPQSPPNFGIYDWKSPSYNTTVDPAWQVSANAPLGYNYSTLGTVIIPGTIPANKPLVSYYRQTIVVPSLSSYTSLTLNSVRDDGIVIYLNGVEVFRDNMPSVSSVPIPLATTAASNCVGLVGGSCAITDVNAPSVTISGSTLSSILVLHPTLNNLTISAEIHQFPSVAGSPLLTSSSDSFFDLNITGVLGSVAPTITRGPYLQLANDGTTANSRPSETTKQIRWTTNVASVGVVKVWKSTDLATTASVWTGASSTDHIINITGLSPNVKYFYEIGVNNPSFTSLEVGPNNYFLTGPITTAEVTAKKTRIWVTGDAGYSQNGDVDYSGLPFAPSSANYNEVQDSVLTGFNTWMTENGNPQLDFWMLLGDNAYLNGTSTEYQNYFFNPFQSSKMMKQATIFSCPGNHDYYESRGSGLKNSIRNGIPYSYTNIYPSTSSTIDIVDANSRNYAFFETFQNLEKGQSGGVPSNAKGYYSFNYGNIHFVSLDSYGSETNVKLSETLASAQKTWLMADLTANDANSLIKWTVIIFHHPPYTKGSYDSDTRRELLDLANNLVPVFEAHKVDLVLNGHSHVYERSRQLKNLFGSPAYLPHANFNSSVHNINSSSGKFDGSSDSCPYVSTSSNTASVNGIVYAIVGSSSTVQSSSTISSLAGHNAMPYKDYLTGGTMILEIENNRLDAKFINELGNVGDNFTILKDVNTGVPIVNNIHQNELPAESPALQKIQTPAWPGVSQFTLTNPSGVTSSPFGPGVVNVTTPDIGALYTIKDQFGCLSQTYRFTFNGSCWGNVTVNNTFYPTATPEVVSSSGIITSTSLIKNMANVSFISKVHNNLVTTGTGVLFQAELGAIFSDTINTSISCPPGGM